MNSSPNLIYDSEKSFYSNNVTQIMDSNSNIFLSSSPLFRQALNKSILKSRNKNKNHEIINQFQTNKIFKNNNLKTIKLKFYSLSPTISDREKLTSYYKTTLENNPHEKKTDEQKIEKKLLFKKYKINKNFSQKFHLPKIEDKDLTFLIREKFFKSLDKASTIIETNKQIQSRINEMTNYFQIEKYNKKINEDETKNFFIKKMPKISIKVLKKGEENITENIKKIQKKKESISYLPEEQNEKKKTEEKKPLKNISINLFRKMSFNGILTANTKKNEKKPKSEKHQVNAIISFIKFANKPNAISQFTLNIYNNKAYLFGGLSSGYNNKFWKYDIALRKWDKININKYDEPVPRYGHSSILLGNNIVIFGGETPKNYFKATEEIIIYNIDNNKFSFPRIKKGRISQRKGHICISATQTMLIQGGLNLDTLKIESSSYIFNPIKMDWSSLIYIGEILPKVMYHNAVIVNNFNSYTNQPFSFYKPPHNLPSNRLKKIKIEGIYIFGGINEERIINNDLFVISICKKPCEVYKVKTFGIPPKERFNFKMVFINDYNFIVISGGSGYKQFVFNDLMILDLESLNWIKPIFENDNYYSPQYLIPRTEHEMFFNNGKIYLFGGRDENNYVKTDFECVEFEITNFQY